MKKALFLYGMVFPFALLLSACGGGGGGSSKPSPGPAPSSISSTSSNGISSSSSNESSNEISSSSSSLASSSVRSIARLTIEGAITGFGGDGEVVFNVGSQEFKAVVDSSSGYTLTLEVDDPDLLDKPVTAVATGQGGEEWIQLAALYPSTRDLIKLAKDGVLDSNEYSGVNISPVTTAEYAIVLSKKIPIESEKDFSFIAVQIDPWEKYRQAAYLTRVIANEALSGKYDTTLQMLLDNHTTNALIHISRLKNDNLESELEAIVSDPAQTRFVTSPISGRYLIQTKQFDYLLTLNSDGTGELMTSGTATSEVMIVENKSRTAAFSWNRNAQKIDIELDDPLVYKANGLNAVALDQCESGSYWDPLCELRLEGLSIDLIAGNESATAINIRLDAKLLGEDESIIWKPEASYQASLLDTSKFFKFSAQDLLGGEWSTHFNRYTFSADGMVNRFDLYEHQGTRLRWSLIDGKILLDDGTTILPIYPSGPGFVAMYKLPDLSRAAARGVFKSTPLMKLQNVSMTEAELVGRWTRGFDNYFSASTDYYADGLAQDNYEPKLTSSWSFVDSTHATNLFMSGWYVELELVARDQDKYYFQRCEGNSGQSYSFCTLEPYKIDPTFSERTWWEEWGTPSLYSKDNQYWVFSGYQANVRSNGETSVRKFVKVAPRLLYEISTDKILEMISADTESFEVCEYLSSEICVPTTVFTFRKAPELLVSIVGNGAVHREIDNWSYNVYRKTVSFSVDNQPMKLSIRPDLYHAFNVSGCEGSLDGEYFLIPTLSSSCEVKVEFIPVQ